VARHQRGRSRAPGRRPATPPLRAAAVGAAIAILAIGGYLVARETSIFAVRTVEVAGGTPRVRAQVLRVLKPELGRSLLRIDEGALSKRVDRLPDVVSVHFSRSFPHTLRVTVHAERAVLLVRQGASSWVVSARGRVMRKIANPRRSSLPRLWLSQSVALSVGETLPAYEGKLAAAAVAPILRRAYPGGIRSVMSAPEALTLVLGAGTEIRLGDLGDLRLKLAIARRILEIAARKGESSPVYVDVSVPERPVLGTQQS